MRVLCRDAEWLVTRVHSVDFTTGSQIAFCTGADEMVRGHEAAFVTDLDDVIPIDPRDTRLVRDSSHGFQRAKLFLEAQLRQMPLTAAHPNVNGIGAFRPLPFQVKAVEKALQQMRPRLLLADAVGSLADADQVPLLTKPPTKLAEILNYDDPRPRTRATLSEASFISTKKRSLEIFQREVRR